MTTLNDFSFTDGVDYPQVAHITQLRATSLRTEYANTETLSAARQLVDADTPYQILTASGADRDVELPVEATTNHPFVIYNAGATYNLVIKDDAGSITYGTIPPDGISTWAQVNGEGWKHIGLLCSTTAPTSPLAGDIFYETDTGILWTYGTYASASRWVSVNKYSSGSPYLVASGTASISTAAASGIHAGYDIYLDTLYFKHHVLTTNNVSNYWTMTLRKVTTTTAPATGAGTSLAAVTSAASSSGTWTEITTSINAVIDYSGAGMEFPFYDLTVGAGAPGNVWYSVGVSFRLVRP
jgi:hypothetical protein